VTDQATFPIGPIGQVCVVVRDIHRVMEHYWRVLGVGPWRVYTYGAPLVRRMTFRGQPADFQMRVAFAQTPGFQLELIQPLRGPTIYHEFLERSGEGIHHFGIYVPNLDEGIAKARAAGFDVIMSGHGTGVRGDGGFAYLGTEDALQAIYELIEIPSERFPPEEIYPTS
jgi:hypothetical protein